MKTILYKPFLSVFLILICVYLPSVKAQSPIDLELDSLISWLDQHIYDKGDSIYQYAHLALNKAKKEGDIKKIAHTHQNLASWHFGSMYSENNDSVLFHDEQALQSYLQTNDSLAIAKAYSYCGTDLSNAKDYAKAQEYIFKSIKIYESLKAEKEIAVAYSKLAFIFVDMGNNVGAIKYGEISYKKLIRLKLEGGPEMEPLFYLSRAYADNGEAEKALERANMAIAVVAANGGEENVGGTLKAFGLRGGAYEALGKYDDAMLDYEYAWDFAKSAVEEENQANGYAGDIGNILRIKGQYKEAIPLLEKFIQHHYGRFTTYTNKYHLYLAECYKKTGQTAKALEHTEEGWMIRDSMNLSKIESLESELAVKYETEKKDATIDAQQERIGYQQQIQYLFMGIGALLLLLLGGLYWIFRDKKQRNLQLETLNEALNTKNNQNELLLKEIHHRVKNNLQVVSGLLELQSAQIDDPNIQDAILASQNRVHSMGIIHQKLYQGENLAAIEMQDYFLNLSDSILDAFGVGERIQIECIMDKLELDVDTAVPIGLIVNELLTNALKYAFPDGRKGKIKIQLSETDKEGLHLTIKDNGIGKDLHSEAQRTGFGTQLIKLLTLQLQGKMHEKIEKGTIISFDLKRIKAA